jgi:hypothetical protein
MKVFNMKNSTKIPASIISSNAMPFDVRVEEEDRLGPIAKRFFLSMLLRVHWSDCKVRWQLDGTPAGIIDLLEKAAREYKDAGGGWETWT